MPFDPTISFLGISPQEILKQMHKRVSKDYIVILFVLVKNYKENKSLW